MPNEIDFYHFNNQGARDLAFEMEKRMGIKASRLFFENFSQLDPKMRFIVFNGDGYQHHLTRKVVKDLIGKRSEAGLPAFSYVHIDGHDDITPKQVGDDDSYDCFVLGINKDNDGGTYIFEQGISGKKYGMRFITPKGPESWGAFTRRLRDKGVYVSIDFDVLDFGSGIHHLFPQQPINFKVPDLIRVIERLAAKRDIIGADLVGFSQKGATQNQIEASLSNIVLITEKLIEVMS